MKKIGIVIASLIAILVMATSVYAAEWKQNEDNSWSYIDNYGEKVTDTFKKSGDNWYYLNNDGVIATSTVVEDNSKFYYVNAEGIMEGNVWKFTAKPGDEDQHWMHFGASGKADESGWKTINDKKYHFTNHYMDYGFLDAEGNMIDKDDDEAWSSAMYYCGAEDNGAQHQGWLKVEGTNNDSGYVWLYFGTNGKKYVDCVKVINGKKYGFGNDGAMVMEWAIATVATASGTNYYKEDSGLIKKDWFWGIKGDADEEAWYYFDGKGVAYTNVVKTINGKKYAFDGTGKMLTGFVEVNDNNEVVGPAIAAENVKFADATGAGLGAKYMYFAESADRMLQGPAASGKTVIEIEDAKISVNFSARGVAETSNGAFVIKKGYAYVNSVLYAREDIDYKYEVIADENGDAYILTVKSGKASNKGTFTDNDNNVKYIIKDGVVTIQHKNSAGKWE